MLTFIKLIGAGVAEHDPVVDRLLPNGAGGTRFFEDLDGNAGVVFDALPAVGVAADIDSSGWIEATELHERAHLLYTFLPEEVSRLMARLPAHQAMRRHVRQ